LNVKQEIIESLKGAAKDNRIPCAEALRIAEKLGVAPVEVGRAADELKIKIIKCQLGCF